MILERTLSVAVVIPLLVAIAGVGGAVMWLCHGHLIYSLDDPYITLSLAWHIARGHYGINAGEAASPASSILYPFLLAGAGRSAVLEWTPAVINALAAAGTG